MELSRKDKFQSSKKSGKKGVKTAVVALGITVLFGTGTVFGATNWGATITNYALDLVGIETDTIKTVNTATQEQELRDHVAAEKTRVDAIKGQGTTMKGEVESAISQEVADTKAEITQAADTAINNANASLEQAKETELTEHQANIDAIADEFFTEVEETTPAE